MDIVTEHGGQQTGFLAASADEYAACLREIFDPTFQGRNQRTPVMTG